MSKQTCWVLTGPTASGKTSLSIRLAKAHDCEIVCMDSMQIYRRMDIGTAKPMPEEMEGIPHHMIDVADPDESFSVARYQEMAEECIAGIHARGKRVLLVGGTGLYLRALRQPMAMGDAAADEAIRAELEAIALEPEGKQRLHDMLEAADPVTAARLHVNDSRRVIRALEVYRLTGVPFSQQPQIQTDSRFDYRVATLTMDRSILYQRIEKRIDIMFGQGLADEVRGLLDSGVPADAQAMKAIGYKELVPYVRGEASFEETDYLLKLNTRHYAKRQLTWMRREEDVLWVDSLSPDAYETLENWYLYGAGKAGEGAEA
ncbi:MAG: tRNA (adenosine(37)-N6)-dimethylallyltransferase MiaA [Clostridiales bacterium]|nr:tRNA (adenosine(37)-N6)-dimethylallyltransferase MiaA [Clostridiales bacterium]